MTEERRLVASRLAESPVATYVVSGGGSMTRKYKRPMEEELHYTALRGSSPGCKEEKARAGAAGGIRIGK